MPFRTFNSWLFDGSKTSPIPEPRTDKKGKVIIPDILKYNSPITHTYMISLFVKHGPLNHYLDKHFNDINLRYLDKRELMLFTKKCVLDFRIKRRETSFFPFKRQEKLTKELRRRFPMLKPYDISYLCKLIDKSDDKESIYQTLSVEVPKKRKVTLKKKKKGGKKISLKEFLEENFSIIQDA